MHLFILSSLLTSLLLLGCSGHGLQDWADETFNETETTQKREELTATQTSPTDNQALNSISPSKTATSQDGTMQKGLDSWTKEEWRPAIEQNETIKAQERDKERPFTLQEYVDKAGVYIENKPEKSGPSHAEKVESLPVIGK